MSSGYIYLLINQSMEGIVKIGKTTRDPQNRVNELSSATGVPTPFTLVYKEYFNNCSDAEIAIHIALESYRVSNNREFFKVPIYEAIDIIKNIHENQNGLKSQESEKKVSNNISNLAYEFLKTGIDYYYGYNDKLEDYTEAVDYLKRASKLGAVEPYRLLGDMYQFGFGCEPNIELALEYYKEGARKGHNHCYAQMGIIFLSKREYKHIENGKKCFELYFNNFNTDFIFRKDIEHLKNYLKLMYRNNIEINHQNILGLYKNRILKSLDNELESYYDWYKDNEELRDYMLDELNEIKEQILTDITEFEASETFYAEVDDISPLEGHGVIITTQVKSGTISKYDNIEILGRNCKITKPILVIEKGRQLVDSAKVGDDIGILVDGEMEDLLFIYDLATLKIAD